MARKLTKEEFIAKARMVHGDKYDYSKVDYKGSDVSVCIICPIHGEFWQRAINHLSGRGCPDCGNEKISQKRRMSLDEFIEKAKDIHGDFYDYSKVDYKDSHTKVCIICPNHGEFWQTPASHLNGNGCWKCRNEKLKDIKSDSYESFVEKARLTHGAFYDYSKSIYNGTYEPILIVCPAHGEFWQRPSHHLHGHGCPKCARENFGQSRRMSIENFIEKSIAVHGNRYSYELIDSYVNCDTPVPIMCKRHGVFWQTPYLHTHGCGCRRCNESYGEREIAKWLDTHNVGYMREYWITPQQVLFGRKKFRVDFFISKHNVIIEYHGQQHYEKVEIWQSDEDFQIQQDRDQRLREYCKQHKIRLIEIPYTEIENIEKILDKNLRCVLC